MADETDKLKLAARTITGSGIMQELQEDFSGDDICMEFGELVFPSPFIHSEENAVMLLEWETRVRREQRWARKAPKEVEESSKALFWYLALPV